MGKRLGEPEISRKRVKPEALVNDEPTRRRYSEALRRCAYDDIVKCVAYNDVLDKLMTDGYGVGTKVAQSTAAKIYADAKKMIRADFEAQKKELKETFLSNLMNIAKDAMEHNDRMNAVNAIKEAIKLTGASEPTKLEMDSRITINFGFDDEEDEEKEEDTKGEE